MLLNLEIDIDCRVHYVICDPKNHKNIVCMGARR
jgi:hypothetical protein